MNKEKCLWAYRHLVKGSYSRWWKYHGKHAKPHYLEFDKPMYKGDYKALLLIKQLIEEHLDNPPLCYSEIEEDKWIAIEEKFPEENKYVDITFIYKDDNDIDYDYYTDVARYCCKMWIDGHGMPIIGDIIAWKSRPEPYRKEKER